jgi:hypothetical protein
MCYLACLCTPVEFGGLLIGGWVGILLHVFVSSCIEVLATHNAAFPEPSKCMTVILFYHNVLFGILVHACYIWWSST